MATVLDPYALTTLDLANYELGLTSDSGAVDAHIENLINQASDIIELAINRKLKIRLYVKERHSGNKQEILYFEQYPVVAVNLDNLVWNAAGKTVTRNDGGSFVKDGFADGNEILVQNSDLNGGLLTVNGVVTQHVITFDEVIVDDTDDDNVILSHCRELWVNDSELDEDDYEVNEDHIYYNTGFSEGHENIRVTYYAGYVTIPDDIVYVCLKIVKMLYEKVDGLIQAEKLGPYSVQYALTGIVLDRLPTDCKNILDKYTNVGAE